MRNKRTTALVIGLLLIPLGLIIGSQLLLVSDQLPDVPRQPVVVSNTPSSTGSTATPDANKNAAKDKVSKDEPKKDGDTKATSKPAEKPKPQPTSTPAPKQQVQKAPAPRTTTGDDDDDDDDGAESDDE